MATLNHRQFRAAYRIRIAHCHPHAFNSGHYLVTKDSRRVCTQGKFDTLHFCPGNFSFSGRQFLSITWFYLLKAQLAGSPEGP